jgi:hypothetical protein
VRQWQVWRPVLVLLLATLLGTLATATFEGDQPAAHHEAALTAHDAGPATVARPAGRLFAERSVGPVELAVPPANADRPVPFTHRDHRTETHLHPRTRQAPSAGDRAPPSH